MARAELMSAADAVWLHMDDPTNLMFVAGVFFFDRPLDVARLKTTLEVRLLRFKRFRQRVVAGPALSNPRWEEDPHFDINAHVHRLALAAPGDQAALQKMISLLISSPLDRSKPLWQMHILENYQGDGCALLVRIHHAIADGIALVYVMMSLMDEGPDAPWPTPQAETARRQRGWNPLDILLRPATVAWQTTQRLTTQAVVQGYDMLMQPTKALELAQSAGAFVSTVRHMLSLGSDTPTVLKGQLGVPKKVAWSAPLDLTEVKEVGRIIGATVNDVLLTLFAGALRRYLAGRGEPVDQIEIRLMVPVTLRPLEKAANLGNNFGTLTLPLPIREADPVERLRLLKEQMDALKQSPEALITFAAMATVGYTPAQLASKIIEIFNRSASAIMTNVPGPRQPVYIAGQVVKGIMIWGPLGGRIGLGASIFSYNGEVTLGIFGDAGLVPDPETIVAGFVTEFAELKRLVGEPQTAA